MALFKKPQLATSLLPNRAFWSFCIASALVVGGVGLMAAQPALAVEAWTRWETTLTSSKTYTNPYAKVTLAVTYTSPSGQQYHTYGFWDGGNTFKLRFMFPPEIGKWTWRTTSSDTTNTGLHDKSETVAVTSYTSGDNRLYRHGYLRVSANQRYLAHHDGTGFLWKGDTAWMAPIAASHAWGSSDPAAPPEWEDYIQKRKSQNFNVIQVNIIDGFSNLPVNRNNHAPFEGSGPTLRWNPAFWQSLEQKIQYANTQGFVIFITGVGSPGHGFPSTNLAQVRLFARNLAARLMGNFVVFSPTADEFVHAQADAAGNELVSSTPIHLITAHPEMTPASAATTFHARDYTDFVGVQSSMGWLFQPHPESPDQWETGSDSDFSGRLASQYAIEAPLALYNASSLLVRKPVINLEAVYDLAAMHDGSSSRYYGQFQQPYPTRLVRSTAYLSMLSGSKGITYGCQGVWNWGNQGVAGIFGTGWNFTTGLNQPSATHMKYLFTLFEGLQWWALEPAHHLIQNQSTNQLTRMVIATTLDNNQAVAYLPNNAIIAIHMDRFPRPMVAQWFNPLTNTRQLAVESPIANVGTQTITKPAGAGWEDAVLILTARSSSK